MKSIVALLLAALSAAGQTPPLYTPDSPPRASLIQISAPDATRATSSGCSGRAVSPYNHFSGPARGRDSRHGDARLCSRKR